ncbi:hypothetical protein [Kutzneria sp. NPDC052558]|uniref:hypothetical protein n=1 Tax=Kutzneria sp. NPDC052558 TaxID=3364121 RepID=UPI0037C8D75C
MEIYAHIDEGGGPLPSGRMYGMAAALSTSSDETALRTGLRATLLPHQDHLHHREEGAKRRIEVATTIAELSFTGAVVVTRTTTNTQQEAARARLLTWLLPHLQHVEHVDRIIFESRHTGDQHDRRTGRWLRQSHRITAQMRIDHERKRGDERLWLADFLVGSYLAAQLHNDPEPWEIITSAHVIDVITDPR